MTRRVQESDTEADLRLYACLNSTPPKSFLMVAGAGSGKTTSLIKGLDSVLATHGERLRRRRQRVACITYTEVAAEEVRADVGDNSLIHVSTIHSFLWTIGNTFQLDIKQWIADRIAAKIVELEEAAAGFGPRVQQRTRDKNQSDIVRYRQQLARIGGVRAFNYGSGSNYLKGSLGHDDIIKMVPHFITTFPLMRTLVAQRFPFIFVDESQDTAVEVVAALKAIDADLGSQFCLGFFGDPMQRIYMTGMGEIKPGPDWARISKPENFRCPEAVLNVANAIRSEDDGLMQTLARTEDRDGTRVPVLGSANIFILPRDRRDEQISRVRSWSADHTGDIAWEDNNDNAAVKVLVIVHRMAANRLGFGNLYAALNDKAPDAFKLGFFDGTAWPLRPFKQFVMPLMRAFDSGNEFEVYQTLLRHSPKLDRRSLGQASAAERLAAIRSFKEQLVVMMDPAAGSATILEVLQLIHQTEVIELDPRLTAYLPAIIPSAINEVVTDTVEEDVDDDDDMVELEKEIAAMDAFLACPASELYGYMQYVHGDSPFSTQQGVKGMQFDRVLVVLDDDEGSHNQFSFDKYLGIKALSTRDLANRRDGRETSVERTRRLFYVCCTRSLKDLVVVLFASDVEAARDRIQEKRLFPADAIHTAEQLDGF